MINFSLSHLRVRKKLAVLRRIQLRDIILEWRETIKKNTLSLLEFYDQLFSNLKGIMLELENSI